MRPRARVMASEQMTPRGPARLASLWPLFAIGIGLVTTISWVIFLGWLLFRGVHLIL
jgi:hypothetical protein